ncbi:acyl carrier protein [Pseudonocardia sp. MH-G8]|uniref:acyl carrier protein n=1 Tax=Pseudonocardia sp. MH-G8 TaxID=1854588 RepID=UPI0018E9F4B3|nr:acyl carrier protein [Pseudonocardia sp. MH-G8]
MPDVHDQTLRHEDVVERLREFLVDRVIKDPGAEVDARTPLLEWGILTSLSISELIAYIRSDFGLFVPPEAVFGANFKDLGAISALVVSLQADPAARV